MRRLIIEGNYQSTYQRSKNPTLKKKVKPAPLLLPVEQPQKPELKAASGPDYLSKNQPRLLPNGAKMFAAPQETEEISSRGLPNDGPSLEVDARLIASSSAYRSFLLLTLESTS